MSLLSSELSLLLCACAAAVPTMVFCVTAHARSQSESQHDADATSLLAKIDAARGKPAEQPISLAIEGTIKVTFEGIPAAESVLTGTFRETFLGATRARHRGDLGDMGGVMEQGMTDDLVWEIDPVMGAKVHAGSLALSVRRYFALLRGASPGEIYTEITRTGMQELDGREHVLLRMRAAEGKADTWYVDPETGLVSRIDITLPATEGEQAVWGMDQEIDAQLTLGDWKKVGGVLHPHRRTLKMGPASFTSTCTSIETSVKLEPRSFTPPETVVKLKSKSKSKPTVKAFGTEPSYQIVELDAQPVASIRVKCKQNEVSATLAAVLPEIMAHLNASGAKMAGAPFSRYHDMGGAEIDLEAGIPVAKPITEKGRVKNSEFPEGKAVMVWHIGPYEKLTDAHRTLQAYLDANQLKSGGGPWEIYWTDPGVVPDPSKWRTQLFMPIAK